MSEPAHTIDADGDGQPDYAPDTASDARQRAVRTLLQGAVVAGVLALSAVLGTALTAAHGWQDIDWGSLSFLLVQAVGTAVVSYLARYLAPPAA